jgi:hypothetical protein
LRRNGDDFGKKKQQKPTNCEAVGAPLGEEISKQFVRIRTLPGASAYDFSFERKFRAEHLDMSFMGVTT